jgi:hypothetical protein
MADFPPHFYKYRSLKSELEREWVRQTIQHNDFYWAAPSSLNDPFDCAPIFRPPPRGREIEVIRRVFAAELAALNRHDRRAREAELLQNPPELLQANLDRLAPVVMNETAIYSVGSVCDDILMWSHYGASHSGICLRFDPRSLLDEFGVAFPVHYSAERPTIVVGVEDRLAQLQKMLLTKADVWRYEQEWRFIDWRGLAGVRRFPAQALTGVILGSRITDQNAELVRTWVRERDTGPVQVLRAQLDPHLFRIEQVAES